MSSDSTSASGEVDPKQLDVFVTYLDKEMNFQAAMSAVSGGVSVWIVDTLLFYDPSKVPAVLGGTLPVVGRRLAETMVPELTALMFAAASVLFLLQRGQLSIKLGRLARSRALGESIPRDHLAVMVRQIGSPEVVRTLWQYYLARFLFGLGIVGVLFMAAAL